MTQPLQFMLQDVAIEQPKLVPYVLETYVVIDRIEMVPDLPVQVLLVQIGGLHNRNSRLAAYQGLLLPRRRG